MKTEKQGYDSCSTYEEQLNKYGTIIYTNVGRSMMPLLREHRDITVSYTHLTLPTNSRV